MKTENAAERLGCSTLELTCLIDGKIETKGQVGGDCPADACYWVDGSSLCLKHYEERLTMKPSPSFVMRIPPGCYSMNQEDHRDFEGFLEKSHAMLIVNDIRRQLMECIAEAWLYGRTKR